MSFHPDKCHIVWLFRFQKPFPEIHIFYRFISSALPSFFDPAVNPVMGKGMHQILGIGIEFYLTRPGKRLESDDCSHQLHTVVRRIDLTAEAGDFQKILAKVEKAVCEKGGAGRFGTWAYSYGYTVSAGLAQHALNVINGESELADIDDIAKAYHQFSPDASWNGSNYTNAETGVKAENTFLVYQDTYIMGNPGHYMGSTSVEVPEKYFTLK